MTAIPASGEVSFNKSTMLITKADGTQEEFKPDKLRTSLKRAGASKKEIGTIVSKIETSLTEGMRTQIIYRKAFELLRDAEKPAAAKYSLRRALFSLGPTGFPFEDFLERLFAAEGYETTKRLEIKGKCALHEIDVAAYKKDHSFVAEAKFHARPGIKSDLQDALYSYARYLDLQKHPICKEDVCGIGDLYLITNTKFTSSAVKYAECVGIKLLSWDQPRNETLQDRIEAAGLYPVTALSTPSNTHKRRLLENGKILCRDIMSHGEFLKAAGMSSKKIDQTLQEAEMLCTPKNTKN